MNATKNAKIICQLTLDSVREGLMLLGSSFVFGHASLAAPFAALQTP
jgi:hypothetical protein